MMELMKSGAENVVAVRASGKITKDDYLSVIVPAADAAFSKFDKIRVLYVVEDGAEYAAGAMFEDALMGAKHLRGWERIAVVTDLDWMRKAITGFQFLMPCPVKIFANAELKDAEIWIQS
jgi:hypothetical protein